MHKYRLCSLALEVDLVPRGPVLVKSPQQGTVDPAVPDMAFVRTHSPLPTGPRTTVYIPGSSLKGVLRSYCEGVGRALGLRPEVCNPFDEDSHCRREGDASRHPYGESCHVCRLFGSTRLGGRIALADAFPTEETAEDMNKTRNRTGVGIDRLLGSSHAGALYDFEVVEQGVFRASIRVENFELWQVGLLHLALRDLNEGHLRIGLGTSRGLGFVTARVHKAELRYTGLLEENGKDDRRLRNRNAAALPLQQGGKHFLYGVAELLGPEGKPYEMHGRGAVAITIDPDRVRGQGVEIMVSLKLEEDPDPKDGEPLGPLGQVFTACVERLRQEAEAVPGETGP